MLVLAAPHTCAAGANATDLLPDVVVSAGEALRSGTAVGEMVSPSWPRGCTAGATDAPSVVTADIAVASVAGMGAADVAAQGASVADDPVAGCDLGHRRGACLSICLAGLAHGLHLQPRFGRCPRQQRLARGLRFSSSLSPTGSSPPEQAHFPGLLNQVFHLSLHTDETHPGNGKSNCPVLYV